MDLKEYLNQEQILKNIKRFARVKVIRTQNLCEHGYGVGTLFYLLCKEARVTITGEELFRIMNHDFLETYTGDIDRRVKEKTEETSLAWEAIERATVPRHLYCFTDKYLKEEFLTEEKFLLFQLADDLEGFMFCKEEVLSGNRTIRPSLERYRENVKERLRALSSTNIEFTGIWDSIGLEMEGIC